MLRSYCFSLNIPPHVPACLSWTLLNDEKCFPCFPDESLTGSSQPEAAALDAFNKSWAELTDWLTMLDNMVQNKQVVVADVEDIDENINQLKVGT